MEIRKHPILDFWCDEEGGVYDNKGVKKEIKQTVRYTNTFVGGKSRAVHRLIVETWLGEIPKGMQVNHIDGNRQNNSVRNLEICTPSENVQHAFDIGLLESRPGELHHFSKIDKNILYNIKKDINEWYGNKYLAEKYNLNLKHISLLRNGKRWKHLFDGIVTPSYNSPLDRDVFIIMLYLSYFTELSNAEIGRKIGVHASSISRTRHNKLYKWFFNRKEEVKEKFLKIDNETKKKYI